jgi:hypothetical protein
MQKVLHNPQRPLPKRFIVPKTSRYLLLIGFFLFFSVKALPQDSIQWRPGCFFDKQTVEQDLNIIFTRNHLARAAMDARYDKETDFHRDRANQELWNEKLESELSVTAK